MVNHNFTPKYHLNIIDIFWVTTSPNRTILENKHNKVSTIIFATQELIIERKMATLRPVATFINSD